MYGEEHVKKKRRGAPSSPTPMVNNTTASSTTASASDLVGKYEVFLSFRGIDTRNGFTDYLYHDLVDAGVRTFRDDNELRVGEEIGPELLRAIKQSKISIPIFSKNYASSKWCLREFAQMVDCRANGEQMIYPIFYDVEPNEVQHCERGSYKDAFLEHKKDEKLNERDCPALDESIGNNWRLEGVGIEERELVKFIVENILSKLKKNYTHEPQNLVGMDNRIEELKRLLKLDSNYMRIVGIHGMGGLGKTTIAKVIYNQLRERFERCCFLDDVQDNSKQDKDIVNLQNQLLSKIQKREVPKFDDFHNGRDMIKDTVHEKKVLIVLDNVSRYFQIDMLVGDHKWFGDQSLIIITTRNKDVLDIIEKTCRTEGRVEVYKSYRPELLNDKDSLQRFCKHAFRRDSPPKDYEILVGKFVSIDANIPLVLVTLGSSLFIEEDIDVWDEILRNLEKVPQGEVVQKLRFSYEALTYEQKQIFLDIALLFNGYNKRKPCYMWDSCGFCPIQGINVLVRRSLLTISDNGTLIVHDSLRDLGKQIIREEGLSVLGKRSRLRDEEALQVLEARQVSEKLKVLILNCGFHLSRVLHLYAFSSLEVLELVGCGMLCSVHGLEQLKLLKYLDASLCPSLKRLPDLSKLTKLHTLNVSSCTKLIAIQGLDRLASLEHLDIRFCRSLKGLPDLSNLRKLTHLYINSFVAIPGLDRLESLEYLDMRYSMSLEILPNLPNFGMLKDISLRNCIKFQDVETLTVVESLESLDVSFCTALKNMPDLTMFKKLKKLYIRSLKELTELQGLEKLKSLESLDLRWCKSIMNLADFSSLTNLKELEVSYCVELTEIRGLEELESLMSLCIVGCKSLENLPHLPNTKIQYYEVPEEYSSEHQSSDGWEEYSSEHQSSDGWDTSQEHDFSAGSFGKWESEDESS
ncbi:hypothetical protein LguiB_013932 [Lonicera macranthoides]